MPNTLKKDRDLISYTPGTPADPGYPGSPATPARTTYQSVEQRVEVPASAMRVSYTYLTASGILVNVDTIAQVPEVYRNNMAIIWFTPLMQLRSLLNNDSLSATAAHYSDRWANVVVNGTQQHQPVEWTSAWVMQTVKVRIEEPAKPAIPARPPTPAIPARSVYNYNFGWNAGAHSIAELPVDWTGTAQFDIEKPVGAVVGFAPVATTPTGVRYSSGHITHGLIFGDGLIRLREGGETLGTLGSMTGADEIKAMVFGNVIEWYRNDTLLHRGHIEMPGAYYLDAVLYAGNDEVIDPVLTDEVESPADSGVLMMQPLLVEARMGSEWNIAGTMGAMHMLASADEICQGELTMKALRVPFERGSAGLNAPMRAVYVSAAEAGQNGFARPVMRRMEAEGFLVGGDDAWIPEYSIGSLGMLPMIGAATSIVGQNHHYELTLRALDLMASQDAYGESRLAMLPLTGVADGEVITPLVRAQEVLGTVPDLTAVQYIVIAFTETITTTGTASISAAAIVAEALETITATSEASVIARLLEALMEQLGAFEKVTAMAYKVTGTGPGQVITPVEPGEAWAVNAATNGSTRYENFAFNSLMRVKGKAFGVKPTGVYLLEGATDAGAPIQQGIALGKQDFGSQVYKHIEAVYAGVSSTGQLLLRIGDGTNSYTYLARRVDPQLKVQRFDPGKGLRSNYFTFDLMNQYGGQFELDNITFNLAATKRRI